MLSTAFLLAASMVMGQAEGAQANTSPQESLKPFQKLIGTWRYEGAILEDIPGVGKKGDEGTCSISWKWIYGGNALEWRWIFEYGGKLTGTKGLIMWDAAQRRVVGHGVDSDGGNIHVTATIDDDAVRFEVKSVSPDGKGTSQTELYTVNEAGLLLAYAKNRSGLPDLGPVEFRRLKAAKKTTKTE